MALPKSSDFPTSVRVDSGVTASPVDPERLSSPPIGAATSAPTLALAEKFGGDRLLLSDVRLAFMLMNRARHLAITRLLGPLPRDQQNLVTLVVALALTQTAHDRFGRLMRGPALPPAGDNLLVGGLLRDGLLRVAGSPARETPFAGGLLVLAIVGGAAGPSASKSLRAIRASSRGATSGFHHRYGYLVDPGHWRERRAARRLARDGRSGL